MKDSNSELFVHNNTGQSMIEVVIDIAVVVVLAISLITTTLITQKTATSAKNNSQATKLAQQTSEQIRVFRDRNGFNLLPSDPTRCFWLNLNNGPDDPAKWEFSSAFDCSTNANAESIKPDNVNFYRKIQIVNKSSTNKETTVTVTWTESAGTQSVVHKSLISAWCSGEIVAGPSPCPTP